MWEAEYRHHFYQSVRCFLLLDRYRGRHRNRARVGCGQRPVRKGSSLETSSIFGRYLRGAGYLLSISAGGITQIYNTDPEVRRLAASFMRASAIYMPFQAMANCCYFAIRSGGRTLLTMVFDSIYIWVVCIPYTYALVTFTHLGIETVYPPSAK